MSVSVSVVLGDQGLTSRESMVLSDICVCGNSRGKVSCMIRNNGRRSVVNASSVMVGDELLMAGEPNVFVENVIHYSTRYRSPSHCVVVFRQETGRPVARVFDAKDKVSVFETNTTHKARRANSRSRGTNKANYIRREKGVYPVTSTGSNPTSIGDRRWARSR